MTLTPVAVNLLWCVPGGVGGSEQYLVRQLLGLAEQPERAWWPVLFVPKDFVEAHPELAQQFQCVIAPFDGTARSRRVFGEATWLRRHSRGYALAHHGGGTAPRSRRTPYVLTVHDLQYRTFPDTFTPSKLRYLETVIPRSVRGAAVIAVPSEYVRGTVINAFNVSPERVQVIPHGIEPALVHHVTAADELRAKFQLGDGRVVVYPAVTNPHKNHQLLLDLMRDHWRDPDLRLVLIGGQGACEPVIAACADQRVCRLGRVSDADRNGLLAMAHAMVFPSLYEGFGAPLIEAMALGAPVVASDATCIPDVVGEAGLVLPPTAAAWADSLDRVASQREALVAAGWARAQQFTSRASGAALSEAYATALGCA